MQDDIVTATSKSQIVTGVKQALSEITNARKPLEKDRLFYCLWYERILSRCNTFLPEDKTPKPREIHKMRERLLHKIQHQDQLNISWWGCSSHSSLRMSIVSVSTVYDCIIVNAVPCKALPIPNLSKHALKNKLILFLGYWSLTIYDTFQNSILLVVHVFLTEQSFFL